MDALQNAMSESTTSPRPTSNKGGKKEGGGRKKKIKQYEKQLLIYLSKCKR